eukprot:470221-Pleurochrysis_carterae.AAC.1
MGGRSLRVTLGGEELVSVAAPSRASTPTRAPLTVSRTRDRAACVRVRVRVRVRERERARARARLRCRFRCWAPSTACSGCV